MISCIIMYEENVILIDYVTYGRADQSELRAAQGVKQTMDASMAIVMGIFTDVC